jgi:hypothetical protein
MGLLVISGLVVLVVVVPVIVLIVKAPLAPHASPE